MDRADTATTQALIEACVQNGGEAWDHPGMVRALNTLSFANSNRGSPHA